MVALPDPRGQDGEASFEVFQREFFSMDGPFTLSWEQRSANLWRSTLELQLARLSAGQAEMLHFYAEDVRTSYAQVVRPGPLPQQTQIADTHFLLVTVAGLLKHLRRMEEVTEDSRLAKARTDFEAQFADVKDFRDIFEHFDEYAIGGGNLQKASAPPERRVRSDAGFWNRYESRHDASVEVHFHVSDSRQVPLKALARAGMDLAVVIEQVEIDHAGPLDR